MYLYSKLGLILGILLLFATFTHAYNNYDVNWVDTFSDNDYTNNPTWTTSGGTWSAATGQLVETGAEGFIYTPNTSNTNLADANVYYEWKMLTTSTSSGGYQRSFFLGSTNAVNSGNAYWLGCEKTTNCAFRRGNYASPTNVLTGLGTFNENILYTFRIERYTDGNWKIYQNGNFLGSVVDTTYTNNFNYIILHLNNSAGATFDDVNVGKIRYTTTAPSKLSMTINKPNAPTYWNGTENINLTLGDADNTNDLRLKLYYSKTPGAFTNLIYSDTNVHDGVGLICNNYDFGTPRDCNYSWDTTAIMDGNYYIDANFYTPTDANIVSSQAFNIDNTLPSTTLSVYQAAGITVQAARFTCTDANSGCKWLTYRLNSGTWTTVVNSGVKDINFAGAGQFTLDYYSTDNADNNEATQSTTFETFGSANITTYDENTSLGLSGVTINFNGTDYLSTPSKQFTLQGLSTGDYTITFSKTGYDTRYYQIKDLNRFQDINIGMLMISATSGSSTQFKFFAPDATTVLSNYMVEVRGTTKGYYSAGRYQADADGLVTFDLNTGYSGYTFRLTSGTTTYDYNSISLTINKPKDERTQVDINANWSYEITGVATVADINILYSVNSRTLAIYSNTSNSYITRISSESSSPVYFPRTYFITVPGNPAGYTLQPYLVDTTNGVLSTINVRDNYSNNAIPDITLKIYRNLPGTGRTLIEQLLTDSKGQGLSLLIVGNTYEIETYYGLTFLKNYAITANGNSVYLYLELPTDANAPPTPYGYTVTFTPISNQVAKLNAGNYTFTQTVTNFGRINTTYTSKIIQNGVTISTEPWTTTDYNKVFTRTVAFNALAVGAFTSELTINDGVRTYTYKQNYYLNPSTGSYGETYNPILGLKEGLRADLSCSANGICYPLLIIGIIISIAFVVWVSMMLGQFQGQAAAISFVISLALFTYINWIPFELTAGVVLITLAFLVNERRG